MKIGEEFSFFEKFIFRGWERVFGGFVINTEEKLFLELPFVAFLVNSDFFVFSQMRQTSLRYPIHKKLKSKKQPASIHSRSYVGKVMHVDIRAEETRKAIVDNIGRRGGGERERVSRCLCNSAKAVCWNQRLAQNKAFSCFCFFRIFLSCGFSKQK